MKHIPQSILHAAAAHFGMDRHGLEFLGGGQDWSDGTLFQAACGGQQRVIKILQLDPADHAGLQRAEDRLCLVRQFGERGCRIINPIPGIDGQLFRRDSGETCVYLSYAYRKVLGRSTQMADASVRDGSYFRAVGSLLGQLHQSWQEYPELLDPDGRSSCSQVLTGWRSEHAFFASWCHDKVVAEVWDRLKTQLEQLPVDKAGYGFVHNDIHNGNLLFDPADNQTEPDFTLIDFDVANWHWFMNDCAIALYSFITMATGGLESGRPEPDGFRDWSFGCFWEGYRRWREPGSLWLECLELFLHYRRCLLFMPHQELSAEHPEWRQRWIAAIVEGDRRLP